MLMVTTGCHGNRSFAWYVVYFILQFHERELFRIQLFYVSQNGINIYWLTWTYKAEHHHYSRYVNIVSSYHCMYHLCLHHCKTCWMHTMTFSSLSWVIVSQLQPSWPFVTALNPSVENYLLPASQQSVMIWIDLKDKRHYWEVLFLWLSNTYHNCGKTRRQNPITLRFQSHHQSTIKDRYLFFAKS